MMIQEHPPPQLLLHMIVFLLSVYTIVYCKMANGVTDFCAKKIRDKKDFKADENSSDSSKIPEIEREFRLISEYRQN